MKTLNDNEQRNVEALLAAVHRLLAVESRLVAGVNEDGPFGGFSADYEAGSFSADYQLQELRAELNELRRAYHAATEEPQ